MKEEREEEKDVVEEVEEEDDEGAISQHYCHDPTASLVPRLLPSFLSLGTRLPRGLWVILVKCSLTHHQINFNVEHIHTHTHTHIPSI